MEWSWQSELQQLQLFMQNELRPIHACWSSSFRDNNLTGIRATCCWWCFTQVHTFVTLSRSSAEGSRFSLFHTASRIISQEARLTAKDHTMSLQDRPHLPILLLALASLHSLMIPNLGLFPNFTQNSYFSQVLIFECLKFALYFI